MKTRKLSYATLGFWTTLLMIPAFAASGAPPKDRISLKKAEAIALQTHGGRMESHELEEEKGRWVYSFDLRGQDNLIH